MGRCRIVTYNGAAKLWRRVVKRAKEGVVAERILSQKVRTDRVSPTLYSEGPYQALDGPSQILNGPSQAWDVPFEVWNVSFIPHTSHPKSANWLLSLNIGNKTMQ